MNLLRHCALSLLLLSGLAPAHADPNADFVTSLFEQVCLANTDSPDSIRAWATQKKLPEITNPEGRKIYVGEGPDGAAWWVHGDTTEVILSIRSMGACAVFAEAADPGAMQEHFERIAAGFSKRGKLMSAPPDRSQPGPQGLKIGKIRVLAFPEEHKVLILTLITNERAGGAYQGTIQVTAGPMDIKDAGGAR